MASSKFAAPKAEFAPGPPSPASTTTSTTASTVACGGAMHGRRRSSSESASPRRAISSALTTASNPTRAPIPRSAGSSRASQPIPSAAMASPVMARPASNWTASTSAWVHPSNAIVVAASENHPPEAPWVLVPEEQLTHITTIPGETHKQLIRADMTYFDCPGGGEVFSIGSITFCGSLPVQRLRQRHLPHPRQRAEALQQVTATSSSRHPTFRTRRPAPAPSLPSARARCGS